MIGSPRKSHNGNSQLELNPYKFVPLNLNVMNEINSPLPLGIYKGNNEIRSSGQIEELKPKTLNMEILPTYLLLNSDKTGISSPEITHQVKSDDKQDKVSQKNSIPLLEKVDLEVILDKGNDLMYIPYSYSHMNQYNIDLNTSKLASNKYDMNIQDVLRQATGATTVEFALNCRAMGIGLYKATAGEITQISINSFTKNCKKNSFWWTFIQKLEDSSESFYGNIIDNKDGSYITSFICKKAVPHRIDILARNGKDPIGGSPYIVEVSPGETCAETSWASGEGLEYYSTDGTLNLFEIHAVDRMGNPVKHGGDKFDIKGIGGIKIQQIIDLRNGTYKVYYSVPICNLEDFKEIRVKLNGRDIKTPIFHPKKKVEESSEIDDIKEDKCKKSYLFSLLPFDHRSIDVKPTYTLALLLKRLAEMKKTGIDFKTNIPNLMPFPPYYNVNELKNILNRLDYGNIDDSIIINDTLLKSELENYKYNTLKNAAMKLTYHQEILDELSESLRLHCSSGKDYYEKLKVDELKLEAELKEITDYQQKMFATYSCLQQGGIDSLPVSFEIEDPEQIRLRQKKDRVFYKRIHNTLSEKFNQIKSRTCVFEQERQEYTKSLHDTLVNRQKSIKSAQKSYYKILNELEKKYLQLVKKQIRRQDLYKNLRSESLHVYEGLESKKSIDKNLKNSKIYLSNSQEREQSTKSDSDQSFNQSSNIEGRFCIKRRYSNYSCLIPSDPSSPAFWFAEGSYLNKTKDNNREEKPNLIDENSWISCPSSVSVTYSTLVPPTQSTNIKNKTKLTKLNTFNNNKLCSTSLSPSSPPPRDPMLPSEWLNQVEESPWVKYPPNPSSISIKGFGDIKTHQPSNNNIDYNDDLEDNPKLLSNLMWDKDFIVNLHSNAKTNEDFKVISDTWDKYLDNNRKYRDKVFISKMKQLEDIPPRPEKKSEYMTIDIPENIQNDNIKWKNLHYTIDRKNKDCIPWEFLNELAEMNEIPKNKYSNVSDLHKFIIETKCLGSKSADYIK
ncbi:uncharacterized protein CMU_029310 [Cryptosporidium muris RN66]|uniref:Filamin/ABP280 repeat-containing protein n=1 Tax=Cryptosporidium muris (strain RN66) TaxID=441375 RepID=B6AI16_CRYMR|nr:uncharacterized protein CMU_029310 [Cryptosporidium muris RN66]EEA07857.1 hypothetical protein, conserved [Cryptosporidium muris RN66]|eukprot:XP_002142206.1 hypothetical protein [Cryptosporidium muris RN66]